MHCDECDIMICFMYSKTVINFVLEKNVYCIRISL